MDLCIITGFSRSRLRAEGGDWEIGMGRSGTSTLFFSWLKEVASVAVAGFWQPLSVPVWAGHHGGTPKCALAAWEVWVKRFNE